MLSGAVLDDVERTMVAALPVNDEFDLRIHHLGHDLLDRRSQDALAHFVAGLRMMPGTR